MQSRSRFSTCIASVFPGSLANAGIKLGIVCCHADITAQTQRFANQRLGCTPAGGDGMTVCQLLRGGVAQRLTIGFRRELMTVVESLTAVVGNGVFLL